MSKQYQYNKRVDKAINVILENAKAKEYPVLSYINTYGDKVQNRWIQS